MPPVQPEDNVSAESRYLGQSTVFTTLKTGAKFQATPIITTFIIALLLGLGFGIGISRSYFDNKLNEAITMQRMIHNSVVYDIMPWDKTGK